MVAYKRNIDTANISELTISRLSIYLRCVDQLLDLGIEPALVGLEGTSVGGTERFTAALEAMGYDPAVGVVVPQGELIPPEEESFNHTARVCDIGPDGMLYISLGQPHNVQPLDKIEMYDEIGIGGIIRMNRDGTGREVIATGLKPASR